MTCKTCDYKKKMVIDGKKEWFCPFENRRIYMNGKCGKNCSNHSDNFAYLDHREVIK